MSTITKMLLLIGLLLCLTSFSYAQKRNTQFPGCSPESIVFFAYTQSHNSAVELCQVEGGYRFSYGPLKKPYIQHFAVGGDIGRIDLGSSPGFAVKYDNTTWWLDIDEYGQHDLVLSRPDIHGRAEWVIGLASYDWGFQSKLKTWPLPPFAYHKQ